MMNKLSFTHYLLAIILTINSIGLIAQEEGKTFQIVNDQKEKTVIIQGKVVDNKNVGVEFASVFLLKSKIDENTQQKKDILVSSFETPTNGEFVFEDVIFSTDLKIVISAFGFDRYEVMIDKKSPTSIIELGRISLTQTAISELEEVKITASKPLVVLDVDKRIFNVSESTISEGGTAEDVLKNVPSVNVDIDGNVTMRNASPQIFIDGKPTTLTLDQIPAESIESVEVITNPSAKYDASGGGGGILNIVLKKNKKFGYNGSVRAGITSLLGGNIGADINVRQNKFNFSASLSSRIHKGENEGFAIRNNVVNNNSYSTVDQKNSGEMNGGWHSGKIGLDYFLTNKITLSIAGNLTLGTHNRSSLQETYTDSLFNNPSIPKTLYTRTTDNEFKRENYGIDLGYKQLFNKQGQELTFDFRYQVGQNESNALYTSTYFNGTNTENINRISNQKVIGSGNDKRLIAELNFVSPYKWFKVETGLRAAVRNRTTLNDNYFDYSNSGNYTLTYNPASNFKNRDDVYAAYISISKQIKNFGYKIGARAESFNYTGELVTTNETFKNSYPINLFPSAFLTYKLTENSDFQFSYSRRVERPNFRQLIPFVDSVDVFNMRKGNPNLTPENTDLLELSYMQRYKSKNSILASIYYRYTDNLITRFIEKIDENTYINTFMNANSSYATGIELTSQNYFTKWFTATTNINIFNSKINRGADSDYQPEALWSWFGKINLDFKLPKDFSFQLTGMYQSKTNIMANGASEGMMGPPGQAMNSSQGYIDDFYSIDLAIKKNLWKNKATISASINDIFKSRYNKSTTISQYFTQYQEQIMNPRMIRLNFTYKFGKQDILLFKRKTKGINEDVSE